MAAKGQKRRSREAEAELEDEGRARWPRRSLVEFTRALSARRSPLPFLGAVKRVAVSEASPRVLFLSEAIKRLTFEWLCREGGYRKRSVAGGERRLTGRLWENPIWESLELGFGPSSLADLVAMFHFSSGASKTLTLGPPGGQLGDALFRHLLVERLMAWARGGELTLDGAITAGSPVTRFYFPDRQAPTEEEWACLRSDAFGVILTYLDRSVARVWVRSELERTGLSAEQSLPRYELFGQTLWSWLEWARGEEAYDRLLVIGEYFRRCMAALGSRESLIRGVANRVMVDLYSASERERFQRSLGRVYKLGEELDSIYQRVRSKPYLERSPRDHLYLSGYHDIYRPVSNDIRAIGRQFSGEIG